MKTILIALLSLCMVSASCTAVKSIDLSKAPQTISSVVPFYVKFGVEKAQKAGPYLAALATVINTFALGQDLSPEALQTAIATAKIKELQTPIAKDIETMALGLYKTYYSDAVTQKVATVENLAPILKALADAINKGLAPDVVAPAV